MMSLDNIDSVFPLSPMQENMLFYTQTLGNAVANDVLFNQANITLHGNLNRSAFEQAWQLVVNENDALRTGFVWDGLKHPQQFVAKNVALSITYADISELQYETQQSEITRWQSEDKYTGFDTSKASLMRLILLKLGEHDFHLIWSSHHLIVDRWCISVIFSTVIEYYDNLCKGRQIKTRRVAPFKRYIAYLQKRDKTASKAYWRSELSGCQQTTQLCQSNPGTSAYSITHNISPSLYSQVKQFCRRQKLTPSVLIQSAWGLTLNHILDQQDILFGLVVSGRPAQLPGVENIVGSFVNNVPVRLAMPENAGALDWLTSNQKNSFKRSEFEHESLTELHNYTQFDREVALFDHLIVWQSSTALKQSELLALTPHDTELVTAYPFTLCIEEKQEGLLFNGNVKQGWYVPHGEKILACLEDKIRALLNLEEVHYLHQVTGFKVSQNPLPNINLNEYGYTANVVPEEPVAKTEHQGRTRLRADMVQEFLLREWKHILELEHINLDDDFFACGGNSLKAAQLVARVQQLEQKHIPIIALFKGRSIRTMTEVYLSADWSIKPKWVVPVNTKGKGLPIFYIASPEVNTLGYLQLISEMGNDLSGYIVQPPPQSNDIRQVRSHEIPSLSAQYLQKIKRIQPQGPYHIIGMCTGGQIAAEIARQLEAENQSISFLGIINTWAWFTTSKLYHFEKVVDTYRLLRYYAKRFTKLSWNEVKQHIFVKLKNRIFKSNVSGMPSQITRKQGTQAIAQFDTTVKHTQEDGWASERPNNIKKIQHPVTLFKLKYSPYWRIPSYTQGWEYMAEQVNVIDLPDSQQETILREPNLTQFAALFKQALMQTSNNLNS